MYNFLLIVAISLVVNHALGSNFLGGNVNWKYIEKENKVKVCYQLALTDTGRACDETRMTSEPLGSWTCSDGCTVGVDLTSSHQCTGYSTQAGWVEESGCFLITSPSQRPFTISFEGQAWSTGAKETMRSGHLEARIDISTRGDTGRPNSSPVTAVIPVYSLEMGCVHEIPIPFVDPDGDVVRCRWAHRAECGVSCQTLPNATLTKEPCVLNIPVTKEAGYMTGGRYVVTLTLEDYSGAGSKRALSTTPLQFLVTTVSHPGLCGSKPRFHFPSPPDGASLTVVAAERLVIPLAVASQNSISEISKVSPASMRLGPQKRDPSSTWLTSSSLIWSPQVDEVGDHVVCVQAVDSTGKSNIHRCFVVTVKGNNLCESNTCKNGGSCSQSKAGYACDCSAGYFGLSCEFSESQQQCHEDESYCVCDVDGKPAKIPLDTDDPEVKGVTVRDVMDAIIGTAIGLAVGAGLVPFLRHCCLKEKFKKKFHSLKKTDFRRSRSAVSTSLIPPSTAESPFTVSVLTARQITPDVMSFASSKDQFPPAKDFRSSFQSGQRKW